MGIQKRLFQKYRESAPLDKAEEYWINSQKELLLYEEKQRQDELNREV